MAEFEVDSQLLEAFSCSHQFGDAVENDNDMLNSSCVMNSKVNKSDLGVTGLLKHVGEYCDVTFLHIISSYVSLQL
jgi:hypothetical protein